MREDPAYEIDPLPCWNQNKMIMENISDTLNSKEFSFVQSFWKQYLNIKQPLVSSLQFYSWQIIHKYLFVVVHPESAYAEISFPTGFLVALGHRTICIIPKYHFYIL